MTRQGLLKSKDGKNEPQGCKSGPGVVGPFDNRKFLDTVCVGRNLPHHPRFVLLWELPRRKIYGAAIRGG